VWIHTLHWEKQHKMVQISTSNYMNTHISLQKRRKY
jgi:hypothetical protein